MPLVNQSDITDVRLGTVEAGALLAGDKLIWNRRSQYTRSSPGVYTLNVPSWASFMTYILVGGGAGGTAGVYGSTGKGGRAGDTKMDGVEIQPGSSISIDVPTGGRGGTSSQSPEPGKPASIVYNKTVSSRTSIVASRGVGQTGALNGANGTHLRPLSYPYLSAHLDDPNGVFTLPAAGGSPGEAGRFGGGGAGGQSGSFFTSAGDGGAGGDGYAQVVFFGVDPLIEKNSDTPGSSGGRFRGEWAEGVSYVEGDTFTFQGQRFRVKRAHTSGYGASPAHVDTPGIAQSYYERI